MSDPLLVDIADGIGTITLNRPDARNALTRELLDRLVAAFIELDSDPDVGALVLSGNGPAFCAGLDLKELEPGGSLDISELTRAGNPWPVISKPIVGAINGVAVTGGLELALYCDVLVASERARFGDSHTGIGILPFWGLTVELPRAVGYRAAIAMSLTGNFIDAEDAFRLGMVLKVVPHDDLAAAARQVAAEIVSNDSAAVRAMLAAYRETAATTGANAVADEQHRAFRWQVHGFEAEEFARRRAMITARGRTQV